MKCSMHTGKTYSIKHNERDFDKDKWNNDGHIDYSRSELNQTYISQPLYGFFDEQFGAALVEYNERSRAKHPERLIGFSSAQDYDDCPSEERRQRAVKAYYHEQKGKVQEVIIQLGNHEDYCALVADVGQENADNFHTKYLTAAFERWKKENPTLVPFCAVSHLDEVKDGTPHLHIDYLPIAESSRGLTRKVSMDGALKQIGYKRDKQQKYAETPYRQWLRSYRASQEQVAQEYVSLYNYGLSVEPSEPAQAAHEQPQDYKLRQAEKKRKKLEEEMERELKAAQNERERLVSEIKEQGREIIGAAEKAATERVRASEGQAAEILRQANELADSGDFPEGVYQPTGIISKKATMPLETAEKMRSVANTAPYMKKRALKAEQENVSLKNVNEQLTAELNETQEQLNRAIDDNERLKNNIRAYKWAFNEAYEENYDDEDILEILHEMENNQYFYANREPIDYTITEHFHADLLESIRNQGLELRYDVQTGSFFCLTDQRNEVQALMNDYKAFFIPFPDDFNENDKVRVSSYCDNNGITARYSENGKNGIIKLPLKDKDSVESCIKAISGEKHPHKPIIGQGQGRGR